MLNMRNILIWGEEMVTNSHFAALFHANGAAVYTRCTVIQWCKFVNICQEAVCTIFSPNTCWGNADCLAQHKIQLSKDHLIIPPKHGSKKKKKVF